MTEQSAICPVENDEARRAAAMHRVYAYLLQLAARKAAAKQHGQPVNYGEQKAEVQGA